MESALNPSSDAIRLVASTTRCFQYSVRSPCAIDRDGSHFAVASRIAEDTTSFCAAALVITIYALIHLRILEEGSLLIRAYFQQLVLPSARRVFRILTVSEFSKRQILAWSRLPEDRVVVAGNGVDASFSPD